MELKKLWNSHPTLIVGAVLLDARMHTIHYDGFLKFTESLFEFTDPKYSFKLYRAVRKGSQVGGSFDYNKVPKESRLLVSTLLQELYDSDRKHPVLNKWAKAIPKEDTE